MCLKISIITVKEITARKITTIKAYIEIIIRKNTILKRDFFIMALEIILIESKFDIRILDNLTILNI